MIGAIVTEGYRREKNRFVPEPNTENIIDRNHMRGVLIDNVVLSYGATEARTWG